MLTACCSTSNSVSTGQNGQFGARRLEWMATMTKRYDPPPVGASGAPPEAIRMEFARRLQAALNEKGWTQSELARRVAPLLKHSRLGRDNISKYVRGKVLPLPPAVEAIPKVLDRKSTDLLPSCSNAAAQEHPPVSIRDMGDNEMAWLQINMALPWDKVLEIQQIIRRKDGGGGSAPVAPSPFASDV